MKKAIITIHGIHTGDLNTWQDAFRFFVKERDPEVKVFNFEYGYLLAPFALWMNITRKLHLPSWVCRSLVGGFVKFLRARMTEFPDYEFSIIAHSLGTWIAYNALEKATDVKIRNLVLTGGVISSHQEKLKLVEWLEQERLRAVHAWSSHKDTVVSIVAQGFGKLGSRGFVRRDHEEDRLRPKAKPYPAYEIYNHFTDEDHSGVLQKLGKYGPDLFGQLTA